MLTRLRPYFLLALLWLGYFHQLLLQPTGVIAGDYSDFIAEHLPAKLFLNREWHATGELPLWNPHHFCGTPFVHDIQVGAFYPPYAIVYVLPEQSVGCALTWVIALHTLLGGITTFLYARWRGLGEVSGLVAGVGVMLSAKWLTHLLLAGHTVTVGLAWLPLVLLGLEATIKRFSILNVLGTGLAVALLILGTHPQWVFYGVVFAALWTLGTAMEIGGVGGLLRWAGAGLAVGLIAGGLTAVQLLPTLEASGQSARTVALAETWSAKIPLAILAKAFGPDPDSTNPTVQWESRTLIGVYWLALAVLAVILGGRRARWEGAVVGLLLLFVLFGGFISHQLPGFSVFRNPSRMALILSFPLAFLAAEAVHRLSTRDREDLGLRLLRWLVPAVVLVSIAPTLTCFSIIEVSKGHPKPLWLPFVAYWLAVGVGFPLVLLAGWLPTSRSVLRIVLPAAVLLAESVVPVFRFLQIKTAAELFANTPLSEQFAVRGKPGFGRVADWPTESKNSASSPQGIGEPMSLVKDYSSIQGYNPLDIRHYREFLFYIEGGEGRLLSLHPMTLPVPPCPSPRRRNLFDHLNVVAVAVPDGTAPQQFNPAGFQPVLRVPGLQPLPLISPACPRPLPPYTLYENPTALPRAWVVPIAEPMPEGQEAKALFATDFRQKVLLSGEAPIAARANGPLATVAITEYAANRVTLSSDGGTGWMVLADVWFPGWVCRIDGVEVPIRRANHAFRAVELPAGAKRVEFRFQPGSYRSGWWISAGMLAVVVVLGVAGFVFSRSRPRKTSTIPAQS